MNQKLKTVGISIGLTFILGIYACSNSNPTPIPTAPSVGISTNPSELPTPGWITPNGSELPTTKPTRTTADQPTPPEVDPEPTTPPRPTLTAPEAGTPATQFAARWGKRYPGVPEYAILKAANATCSIIAKSGQDWTNDPATLAAIELALKAIDMPSNDALEFAQDAEQNYCSSVENPT